LVDSSASPRWHFASAVAAWLVPGLGHWLIGQKRRALILCLSIGLLWVGGGFIGGIGVFDRKAHPIWFAGQVLIAPSILVEKWHVSLQGVDVSPPMPDAATIAYQPSYANIHEQGVLYTALAGMLNLLAIMDVLYQDSRARAPKPAPSAPAPQTLQAAGRPHDPDLQPDGGAA